MEYPILGWKASQFIKALSGKRVKRNVAMVENIIK